jgi:hypothetical protein
VVTVAGSEPQAVDLTLARVRLPRPDNDVVIASPIVSATTPCWNAARMATG